MNTKPPRKIIHIPISKIRIINPRNRNQDKFRLVRENIANVGLKKPIIVSMRSHDEKNHGTAYDLVCGQGRIEAYQAMARTEIPAIVINVSRTDRLLMSLVENMARRRLSGLEQMTEIMRLRTSGYSQKEISIKLGFGESYIHDLFTLIDAKEERLLAAVLGGRLPISMAVIIARSSDAETQNILMKACEDGKIKQRSLREIRKIVERRRFLGAMRQGKKGTKDAGDTARGIVAAFKRGSEKLKITVHKARICETRLAFLTTALKRLYANENFITLLRAENLDDLPESLAKRVAQGSSS